LNIFRRLLFEIYTNLTLQMFPYLLCGICIVSNILKVYTKRGEGWSFLLTDLQTIGEVG